MSKEFDITQEFGGRPEYIQTKESMRAGAHELAALIDHLLKEVPMPAGGLGQQVAESHDEVVEISRNFPRVLANTEQVYMAQTIDVEYVRTQSKLTTSLYRVASRWVLVDSMFTEPVGLRSVYELGFHGEKCEDPTYMQMDAPDVLGESRDDLTIESRPMLPYDQACLRTELTALMGRLGCALPPGLAKPDQ